MTVAAVNDAPVATDDACRYQRRYPGHCRCLAK
ncbi:MAG: hypothetical protein AB2820_01840 [Candidatus Thiodiazotropha sp.]